MLRRMGMVALLVILAGVPAWAQDNPFARVTRWSAVESWNKDKLVYTFQPDSTFRSSKWDDGKGHGTWMRDGRSFVMVWPRYNNAVYVGTIGDREIRGSGFSSSGKSFGTFVLRLMP